LVTFKGAGGQVFLVGGGNVVRLLRTNANVLPIANDTEKIAWLEHVVMDADFA